MRMPCDTALCSCGAVQVLMSAAFLHNPAAPIPTPGLQREPATLEACTPALQGSPAAGQGIGPLGAARPKMGWPWGCSACQGTLSRALYTGPARALGIYLGQNAVPGVQGLMGAWVCMDLCFVCLGCKG